MSVQEVGQDMEQKGHGAGGGGDSFTLLSLSAQLWLNLYSSPSGEARR